MYVVQKQFVSTSICKTHCGRCLWFLTARTCCTTVIWDVAFIGKRKGEVPVLAEASFSPLFYWVCISGGTASLPRWKRYHLWHLNTWLLHEIKRAEELLWASGLSHSWVSLPAVSGHVGEPDNVRFSLHSQCTIFVPMQKREAQHTVKHHYISFLFFFVLNFCLYHILPYRCFSSYRSDFPSQCHDCASVCGAQHSGLGLLVGNWNHNQGC